MAACRKETQILKAAENLFTGRRFHEVTMDDVCETAGVGKGTIYRYFKDKDDLFLRVMVAGHAELCQLVRDAASQDGALEGRLARILREIHKYIGGRRRLFRLTMIVESGYTQFKGPIRETFQEKRRELGREVAALIRRGVEQKELRGDLPAELMADCLLGMLRAAVAHPCESKSEAASPAQVARLFMKGAAAPGPTG